MTALSFVQTQTRDVLQKRNGVVSRGVFPHSVADEARDSSAVAAAATGSADNEDVFRADRPPVASDTDSEEEYAVPPEAMSGDECVVMDGVYIQDTTSHSRHNHPHNMSLNLTEQVPTDDHFNGEMCDPVVSELSDSASVSGRSSACDLGNSGLIRSPIKIPNSSTLPNCSNRISVLRPLKRNFLQRERNMSVPLQACSSSVMMEEQGGPRGGGGGGDDVVLVLRQMQGDLQAMTQCLQAHLNDISQCLAALHRTSIALQAHSEGAGGGGGSGGGGGAVSPVSEVVQHRQRQWWPFPELSPRSTFWLLLWPVLLQVALHACKVAFKMRIRRKKKLLSAA
ncbi:hypothetical protein FHG87_018584 [Trinorchestia longiramus]|nr:hypothetical protein FHG87_018584 [Trinorchestia longiramus]